ncbi:SDR family oxidoreductase [Pontibacter sp. 172403-2]|uniref:SDR family oxidoreductase n=1 Tax=Pontibacter rufus TaxID=2791028 RepID=UPI0018B00215|nr:SDR family oxidoreductase [Pontibacter sp. 172403-2]MBF9254917.1 SDR family oxidoreductase [Pontibacter sp. 172403-2]
MDLELKGKVIVVTGGAKGIGEGIVKVLAAEGAIPVIVGRNEQDNQKVVTEVKAAGGDALQVIAELTDPEACKKAIQEVMQKCGRIDGLVNNAGLNDGVSLENGSYDAFVASLHNSVVHYYLMAHYALPALRQSKGAIVNISSKTAETGQGGTSGYAASNGARNALTREWAVELLPHSIRVNAVIVAEAWTPQYASWINTFEDPAGRLKVITDRIPLEKRMTTCDEIANAVAFLLSSRSSHTTGQLIHVDGGYVHLDRAL